MIRGVTNGPCPKWLQDRLRAIGLRPISFLVDVTNFFTYDRNRPLHVFDADKVEGDLRVHRAKGGETIVALDDKTYTFERGMIVISDDDGVQSIAGVMGGAATGCTAETVERLRRGAIGTPCRSPTRAARSRSIPTPATASSAASTRRTRLQALEHATRMILDLCGRRGLRGRGRGQMPHRRAPTGSTRPGHVAGRHGHPRNRAAPDADGARLPLEGDMAHVPSWRPDVQGEADLVEEVARIASLTKLKGAAAALQPGVPKPSCRRRRSASRRAPHRRGAGLQRMRDLQLHRPHQLRDRRRLPRAC